MNKKLLILTILITFIVPLFLNIYKVEANNEIIDSEILIDASSSNTIELNETTSANTENANVTNSNKELLEDAKVKATESNEITEEDWTDFSNAKFELNKEGRTGAKVEISGVNLKDASSGSIRYYLLITPNNTKPEITPEWKNSVIELKKAEKENVLISTNSQQVAKYVELNQDLYACVIEKIWVKGDEVKNIRLYGTKLTRFSEPKFSDAFYATHMTNDSDQIVTNFTHNKENNRKIQIKVGKITDTSILQKIKEKKATGFEELLNYAKSNNGIYNQILEANKDSNFDIDYSTGIFDSRKVNSVIKLDGLVDKEYYFLYVKTDDENGKYVSNDAITLAQANVYNNGWGLFFYGSNDFKWSEWNTTVEPVNLPVNHDTSVVPTSLPYTGAKYLLYGALISAVTAIGIFAYKKYKYYNF